MGGIWASFFLRCDGGPFGEWGTSVHQQEVHTKMHQETKVATNDICVAGIEVNKEMAMIFSLAAIKPASCVDTTLGLEITLAFGAGPFIVSVPKQRVGGQLSFPTSCLWREEQETSVDPGSPSRILRRLLFPTSHKVGALQP